MKAKSRRPRLAGFVRERGESRSLVVTFEGKQYSRAVKVRTKKEALAMLPAFIAEVQSGKVGAERQAIAKRDAAPIFRDCIDGYILDHLPADADGSSTRKAYKYGLTTMALDIGNEKISAITEPMVRRCLRGLHIPPEGGRKPISIRTVMGIHNVARRFFAQQVKDGLIAASPVPAFKDLAFGKRGQAKEAQGGRNALTAGQVALLFNALADHPERRLWTEIMLATGARPGEALGIRWEDVDFGRSTIHIRHSVKKGTAWGKWRLGSTKNTGSVRDIPLGQRLAASLVAEKSRQEAMLRRLHGIPDGVEPIAPLIHAADCIFPAGVEIHERKLPRSLNAMRFYWTKAARDAGLPATVSPHWLRHTAISAMVAGSETRAGISIVEAARLAGHSDPGITGRVYAHAMAENLKRGADLADDLIGAATGSSDIEVAKLPLAKGFK